MKKNKAVGIILITLIYLFTIGVGIGLYYLFPEELKTQELLVLLILDIICTVIIFIFSCIFKNSSVYDPYWSVAPLVLVIAYCCFTGYNNILSIIFVCLIGLWSVRLTFNWALNFKNLSVQDWRYQNFKDKHPKTYFLINLFGIHLFPTMIVFIGLLPGLYFIELTMQISILNGRTILSFVLMLAATIIELIADTQMYLFRKNNNVPGAVMDKGLWKRSRHPNYFGEILFWVSIWLCLLSVHNDFLIAMLMAACPIAIFVMFHFVSIPMLEKRQLKNKPGYREYMENTNGLILFPLLKSTKK